MYVYIFNILCNIISVRFSVGASVFCRKRHLKTVFHLPFSTIFPFDFSSAWRFSVNQEARNGNENNIFFPWKQPQKLNQTSKSSRKKLNQNFQSLIYLHTGSENPTPSKLEPEPLALQSPVSEAWQRWRFERSRCSDRLEEYSWSSISRFWADNKRDHGPRARAPRIFWRLVLLSLELADLAFARRNSYIAITGLPPPPIFAKTLCWSLPVAAMKPDLSSAIARDGDRILARDEHTTSWRRIVIRNEPTFTIAYKTPLNQLNSFGFD